MTSGTPARFYGRCIRQKDNEVHSIQLFKIIFNQQTMNQLLKLAFLFWVGAFFINTSGYGQLAYKADDSIVTGSKNHG